MSRGEASAPRPITVLALVDHYLPGYRLGGPTRSLANLVSVLADECRFRILTRNHDHGDPRPFPGVPSNRWVEKEGARVFYGSREALSTRAMARLIGETPHDVLYLNSFFSKRFGALPILLLRAGMIPRRPTIVAPRGEFAPGALRIKWPRKRAFLRVSRAMRLHSGVLWHASRQEEVEQILRLMGRRAPVHLAPVPPPSLRPAHRVRAKRPGSLDAVSIARIAPIKNLALTLRILRRIEGRVRLEVHGPIGDRSYWASCRTLIDGLPTNIEVVHRGPLPHERVGDVLSSSHLFILPTLGESHGHAVLESLLAGCPVLISDRTQWRGLEPAGAGWDLPLEDAEGFRVALQRAVDMDEEEFRRLSEGARALATRWVDANRFRDRNAELFRRAVGFESALP